MRALATIIGAMEPVLVSACLVGRQCRYDGSHNADDGLLAELEAAGRVPVPFCPEEAGGLSTPRPAAWFEGGDAGAALDGTARLVTGKDEDVTAAFLKGAREALRTCKEVGARRAYLKEGSPSCGVERTHVSGKAVPGRGLTAELLARAGVTVEGVRGGRSVADTGQADAEEEAVPPHLRKRKP
jgi:uncharacterized protein YbbK (DUF523 family)